MTSLDANLNAIVSVVKLIGDTATVALQVGDVILPVLQDIGLVFAPSAVAANYVAVALPYITEIAKYAPAVQAGIQNNKPLIEAAVSVGDVLLSPLLGLMNDIPGLPDVSDFFKSLDLYTPQDPRFQHGAPLA